MENYKYLRFGDTIIPIDSIIQINVLDKSLKYRLGESVFEIKLHEEAFSKLMEGIMPSTLVALL